MGVFETDARYKDLLRTVGKRVLNTIYPNDIEIYIVAFEQSYLAIISFMGMPAL